MDLHIWAKSGFYSWSCQDSAGFPPTKARQSTQLRQNSLALYDSDDKRSSFCESNVKTAHISATADTLCPTHPLVPRDITIKEHTKIKDGDGVFIQSFPKTTKDKWGSGDRWDGRVKIIMMLNIKQITRAMVVVAVHRQIDSFSLS